MAESGNTVGSSYSGQYLDPSLLQPDADGSTVSGSDTAFKTQTKKQTALTNLASSLGFDKESLFLDTSNENGALAPPSFQLPESLSDYSFAELTLIVTALLAAVTGKAIENEKTALQDNAEKAKNSADKIQGKLEEAQRKLDEATNLSIFLPIATAILSVVVGLVSGIVTIATLGAAAPVAIALTSIAIALTITVAVVQASGGFEAINKAISDGLIEHYVSQGLTRSQAKKRASDEATGIGVGIQVLIAIVLIVLTLGAAIGQAITNTIKEAAVEGVKIGVKEAIKQIIAKLLLQIKDAVLQAFSKLQEIGQKFAKEGIKAGLKEVGQIVLDAIKALFQGILGKLVAFKDGTKAFGGNVKDALNALKYALTTWTKYSTSAIQSLSEAARFIQGGTQVLQGVGQIAIGGAQLASGLQRAEAGRYQAEAERFAADLVVLRALQDNIEKFIEELLEFLTVINSTAVNVINTEHETQKKVNTIPSNV